MYSKPKRQRTKTEKALAFLQEQKSRQRKPRAVYSSQDSEGNEAQSSGATKSPASSDPPSMRDSIDQLSSKAPEPPNQRPEPTKPHPRNSLSKGSVFQVNLKRKKIPPPNLAFTGGSRNDPAADLAGFCSQRLVPQGPLCPQEPAARAQKQSGGRCATSITAGSIAGTTSGIPGLGSFRLRLGAGPTCSASPLRDAEGASCGPTVLSEKAFDPGLSKVALENRSHAGPQACHVNTDPVQSSTPKREYMSRVLRAG